MFVVGAVSKVAGVASLSSLYRSALGCSEWGLISYAVHAEVIKRRATFGYIDWAISGRSDAN